MKNKILTILIIMFLSLSAVQAETDKIHVSIEESFNTKNPSKTINVRVLEDDMLGSYQLKTGDIIHCNVIKITDPKRGKRAASFAVYPTSFTSEGITTVIKEDYYGKYADKVISKEELKNIDAKKVGKKAALTVGNHFVKGISAAVTLAEGMVENEDGNRIKSGVKKVYKSSPLSYVEKGQQLELEPGEKFYLIFKPSKDENTTNIEEEILEEDGEREEIPEE